MRGFVLLVAIAIAVFVACYSISAMAISSFKHDVYDLLKPFNPPREVVESAFGFANKMVTLTFALLALALAASIFFS